MDAGTKVYRAEVPHDAVNATAPYWISEGEATGIVLDGQPMVRFFNIMLPMNGNDRQPWRATLAEAKRDAWRELVRLAGSLQAKADTLMDEITHDDLTTEEAAA